MKYLSLFSGIGGFELGIERACESDSQRAYIGTKPEPQELSQGRQRVSDERNTLLYPHDNAYPLCIGYSEIDKYAVNIYQSHFPDHKNYGDITKIKSSTLPDLDLICGGFPCQSFSIAGKRGGFADTRGTLFFQICRLAKDKRPRLLLLENVKGLLSHDSGKTFSTIIRTLDELGYDLQWQVLNSKNFGVPQNRERVFIVGNLRGTARPQVFPIRQPEEVYPRPDEDEEEIYGVASTLTARQFASWNGNYIRETKDGFHQYRDDKKKSSIQGTHVTYPNGKSHALNTAHVPMTVVRCHPLRFLERNQKNIEGDYSFTVDTSNTGGVMVDAQIRRLTPVECERLQGFPDGWTEEVSDTQRYKCLGNAVTVNVIAEIMKRLI